MKEERFNKEKTTDQMVFELEDCKMVEKRPNGLLVLECPCCYQNVTGKLDYLEYREEENE